MHTHAARDFDHDVLCGGAAPQSGIGTMRARILGERFQLAEKIGRGAMGAVYRAMDLVDECECAVKLLSPITPATAESYRRFAREASIVAGLFHPHIVDIRHFGCDGDGTPFLVMELLQGQDLFRLTKGNRRLPLAYGLDVLSQASCALQAMHSMGVIHRDIKLQNIFLCQDKNKSSRVGGVVKLVDFGLSTMLGAEQLTGAGTVLGTLEYLSPEGTYGNSQALDTLSDQWSLAVVAYRLLSGYMPFEADNIVSLIVAIRQACPVPLRQRAPGLPQHVCEAIHRALSPRKQDRHESVEALLAGLVNRPSPSRSGALPHPYGAPAATGIAPASLDMPTELASMPRTLSSHVPPRAPSTAGRTQRRIWIMCLVVFALAASSYAVLHVIHGPGQTSRPTLSWPARAPADNTPPAPRPELGAATMPAPKVEALPIRELPPPQRAGSSTKRHHAWARSPSVAPPPPPVVTGRPAPLANPPAPEAPRPPAAAAQERLPVLQDAPGQPGPVPSKLPAEKPPEPMASPSPSGPTHSAGLPVGRRNLQSCGEPPRLPAEVKRLLHGSTVSGQYLLCVNEQGAVQTAKVVRGVEGADDVILAAIRRWRCPPWPIPTCSILNFEFIVE